MTISVNEKTVAEIMVRNVRTVSAEATVNQAAQLLAEYGIRHLVVVDATNKILGVFSEGDLMRHTIHCLSLDKQPGSDTVSEAMVGSPLTAKPETTLVQAAEVLATKKIGCLPVVDSGSRLCGIVSVVDVLRSVGDRAVQPGSAEEVASHRETKSEVACLLNDFEAAKQLYDSHASRMTELIHRLAHEKQRAETSVQVKRDFLANMSHEIRTPMTAILGFTDILLENLTHPEDINTASTIRSNGKHLLSLINDILDFSKIEADRLELEIIPCPIREIADDVFKQLTHKAAGKNVSLELDLSDDLPGTILSDPVRLRQILTNLIDNAIKFTDEGSVRVVVRKSTVIGIPQLQFEVIDTGIGIPAEKLENIFSPFTQADVSIARRFGGTGLGLAISKRLTEMLGGDLTVESQTEQGSTFRFTIEAHTTEEQEKPRYSSVEDRCTETKRELHCHVLLVEDGLDNQRLISHILKKNGAKVTVADNGQVACDLVAKAKDSDNPFDIILMDIQMPVMDGCIATTTLRHNGCTIPIIALTAHAMIGDRVRCIQAGCDDYLTKPIQRTKMIDIIARQLQSCQEDIPNTLSQ